MRRTVIVMRRTVTRAENGSAVVGFALVTPLLVLVAVAVLQVALVAHVRSVLVSAAGEGARAAALAGSSVSLGQARVRGLLSEGVADALVTEVDVRRLRVDGLPVMAVRIHAEIPVVALPTVARVPVTVEGHAVIEGE